MNPLFKNRYNVAIIALITIGTILRFYNFFEIPYTHDELSALYRLNYNSFWEMIKKGVMVDGHPAGIQSFLYLYTNFFGTESTIVKLPFLLCGIGSIWLTFLLAKKWFNSTTGIIAATYITCLQYTIMYSQIARPYSIGLFFSLLMVICWSYLLFNYPQKKYFFAFGFIVATLICCYTHYFSFLLAGIVCLSGLLFLTKQNFKLYLVSLCFITILYIPHLPVFWSQLQLKGVGWLGSPPDVSFLVNYFSYLFHYSWLLIVLTVLLIVLPLFKKPFKSLNRFQIISLSWFLLPIIIGYLYSIFVSPILQFSVLLFTFPFFLLFAFSFYNNNVKHNYTFILIGLILFVGTYTLIANRNHYDIFYKQSFKQFALLSNNFIENNLQSNTSVYIKGNSKYYNYYFDKLAPNLSYNSQEKDRFNPVKFKSEIQNPNMDFIVAGNLERENLGIIKSFFPNLIYKEYGFTYEYYIFGKEQISIKSRTELDTIFTTSLGFENMVDFYSFNSNAIINEHNNSYLQLDSLNEFGASFEMPLSDLKSPHVFIDVSIDFKSSFTPEAYLVCEILSDSKLQNKKYQKLSRYFNHSEKNQWQTAYINLRLTDYFKSVSSLKGHAIKIYIWNVEKQSIGIDNFNVTLTKGNNKVYGLYENIH